MAKPKKKLKVKKKKGFKLKIPKVSPRGQKIMVAIVLIIIILVILSMFGVGTAVLYGIIRKKEGYINMPYSESDPITLGKVQNPTWGNDQHGARCMLNEDGCSNDFAKIYSKRFTKANLQVERDKKKMVRGRDLNYRPTFKPAAVYTFENMGITADLKSKYEDNNITAEMFFDSHTKDRDMDKLTKKVIRESNAKIRRKPPGIVQSHFNKSGMAKYPWRFDL